MARLILHLTDWQLHEDLVLRTDAPVTIVAGDNAAGKSALVDALELLLLGTGRLRGIATKKDLGMLSVRDDADQTRIALSLLPLSLDIARTMTRDGSQEIEIDGTKHPVRRGDAKIWAALGAEPAQIRAALEAKHLLTGDVAERRRILFTATGPDPSKQEVALALAEAGLGEEERARLAKVAIEDGFDLAQKQAEEKRASCSRSMRGRDVSSPVPLWEADWRDEPIDLSTLSIEDLEARSQELTGQVDQLKDRNASSRGALEERLRGARERHGQLREEGERLQAVVEEHGESAGARVDAAERRGKELKGQLDALRAERPGLAEELAAYASGEICKPKICPAIPGGPSCPMTKAKLEAHRKKAQDRRVEVETRLDEIDAEIPRLEAAIDDAQTTWRAARVDQRALQAAQERLPDLHRDLDSTETRIGELQAQADQAQENGVGDQMADLEVRLERLRQTIEAKNAYTAREQQAERNRAAYEEDEQLHEIWDRAAKLLAPSGIPLRLFQARIPAVQQLIDEIGIAPIRMTQDAELEAEVGGRWRRQVQLSESWRLRLSMAASHLVARSVDFPILVLDRFDYLDREGRAAVLKGALRVAPRYPGGVIILATIQRERPEPTGIEGVETLWLRGGAIERIG